jgi:hypothetical protein
MMRRDISRQHELLIELEARYPSNVFYAAPGIEDVTAFDRAYNDAAVARRSSFFSPTEIGQLPDDKTHTIAYKPQVTTAYFFSEPKAVKALTFEQLSTKLHAALAEKRFGVLRNAAGELREQVLDLATPVMRQTEQLIAERVRARRRPSPDQPAYSPEEDRAVTDLLVAREIARVDMGIDVLVAQPR